MHFVGLYYKRNSVPLTNCIRERKRYKMKTEVLNNFKQKTD